MTRDRAAPDSRWWLAFVFLAGILGQLLLAGNPGYFSHDELQWGYAASGSRLADLPWMAWSAIDEFQYRPLTFNLWLVASYFLFDTPQAFHALWVLLGTAVGMLLFKVLAAWGVARAQAALGAVFFLLGPVAAHVHGWVGTLGDLLWVGAALLVCLLALGGSTSGWQRAGKAALMGLLGSCALLAKEAAIVIPALCAIAWLLSPQRRDWMPATIATAVPTLAYLVLRVGTIDAGASGTAYAWSPASVPARWLEYHLYVFLPTTFEPLATLRASGGRLIASAVLCLCVYGLAFAAHWRLGLGLLAGAAAALGPVLLLGTSYAQYAYGFTAVLAGGLAATACMHRPGRMKVAAIGAVVLVSTWHGVNVQRQIHDVGTVQAVFTPQLSALAAMDADAPLRLRAPDGDRWIYERLAHEVPGYRGAAYRRQAVIVGAGEQASHRISPSGAITPEPR